MFPEIRHLQKYADAGKERVEGFNQKCLCGAERYLKGISKLKTYKCDNCLRKARELKKPLTQTPKQKRIYEEYKRAVEEFKRLNENMERPLMEEALSRKHGLIPKSIKNIISRGIKIDNRS